VPDDVGRQERYLRSANNCADLRQRAVEFAVVVQFVVESLANRPTTNGGAQRMRRPRAGYAER